MLKWVLNGGLTFLHQIDLRNGTVEHSPGSRAAGPGPRPPCGASEAGPPCRAASVSPRPSTSCWLPWRPSCASVGWPSPSSCSPAPRPSCQPFSRPVATGDCGIGFALLCPATSASLGSPANHRWMRATELHHVRDLFEIFPYGIGKMKTDNSYPYSAKGIRDQVPRRSAKGGGSVCGAGRLAVDAGPAPPLPHSRFPRGRARGCAGAKGAT